MSPNQNNFRRVLSDWTFIGTLVAAIALITSLAIGRITFGTGVISILLAVWIIALVLMYMRSLEILAETRSSKLELLSEIKKLKIESRNVSINQALPAISMDDFVQREANLSEGDAVLVFANTIELDYMPMFAVVAANLKKGVIYKYILFESEQADDWNRFKRMLKKQGVTNFPEALFESSKIGTLVKSSTAIYDYEDSSKSPEGFCVLATADGIDTCVLLSSVVAKQTRDAFRKAWRTLREVKKVKV